MLCFYALQSYGVEMEVDRLAVDEFTKGQYLVLSKPCCTLDSSTVIDCCSRYACLEVHR